MAYTTLYRKWRPSRFDEVKGQEAIVRTLKNQVISDRVGHAYLFCGTRGTGKTSVAKIMARAVNCEHPTDGNPCNECAVCRSILSGTSVNVIEMDAASNNGVDNIRELKEQVQYSPTEGKYRVFIIDEVHMLSTGAFNALLKTLEEPPAYVLFILATTEVNKIPITVLSRCQRYDFRRMTGDTIADQIRRLLAEEKIEADEDAVRYVAKAADGSMRDALSLLEQCISFYYGERLTYNKVLDVLGAVDTAVFSRLLRLVLQRNVPGCIALMDEVLSQGRELGQFVIDFTWYQRNLMLVQTAAAGASSLEMSEENFRALKEEAEMVDMDTLMRNIRICSELTNKIRFAVSKRVLVELALIRMMQPEMDTDREGILARLEKLEEMAAQGGITASAPVKGEPAQEKTHKTTEAKKEVLVELSSAEYGDYEKLLQDWPSICGKQSPFIHSLLRGSKLGYDKEKGLCVIFEDSFKYSTMAQENRIEDLNVFLNQNYQKEFKLFARLLQSTDAQTRVVRANRIPGIEADIGEE